MNVKRTKAIFVLISFAKIRFFLLNSKKNNTFLDFNPQKTILLGNTFLKSVVFAFLFVYDTLLYMGAAPLSEEEYSIKKDKFMSFSLSICDYSVKKQYFCRLIENRSR